MPKLVQRMIVHYVDYDAPSEITRDMHFARKEGEMESLVAQLKAANGYVPVSAIEYDDKVSLEDNLENAFKLHQNGVVTDSWTLSPPDGLHPLVDPINVDGQAYGHRSMSVGDIVEIGGNQHVVAFMGFKKV